MEGQLRKLRHGIHPKTLEWLPPAIALDLDLRPVKADVDKVMPEGFYTYVAVEPPPLIPSDSNVTAMRRDELRARIKIKEVASKAITDARVRRDSLTCKGKYRIIVKGAACHGRACCEGT